MLTEKTLTDCLAPRMELARSLIRVFFSACPLHWGRPGTKNVILLDPAQGQAGVTIAVDHRLATYVLFLHQVEDRITNYAPGLADFAVDGNELGDLVADYGLQYADDSEVKVPILRRFAIQQSPAWVGAQVPLPPSGIGTQCLFYGERSAGARPTAARALWNQQRASHPDVSAFAKSSEVCPAQPPS